MKITHRFAVIGLAFLLAAAASAQTYLGNGGNLLNGTNVASTFEIGDGNVASLPALGWTTLAGSNVQAWDIAGDGVILDVGGGGFNPYAVRFVTDATFVANSTYTLSLEMGYVSGPYNGGATYAFSIGSWNGSIFTPLQTATGGPVTNFSGFAGGTAGVTQTATFITGGSVSPTDVVAIQWAQTNTSGSGAPPDADFFAVDNVTLSVAAIPEPSTYAVFVGACALGLAAWRRRRVRIV
jgi:hypothetical protein